MGKVGESAGRARLIEHWSVAVNRNGENILTIESNCLSGKDLTLEDQETIRQCARHLLSFVGAAEALAGQEEAPQETDGQVPHAFRQESPEEPFFCDCGFHRDNLRIHPPAKAEEDAPAPPRYPEEHLATRILQEQKDLEAHTRAVTDVDRLTQIRDSLLKEPQP